MAGLRRQRFPGPGHGNGLLPAGPPGLGLGETHQKAVPVGRPAAPSRHRGKGAVRLLQEPQQLLPGDPALTGQGKAALGVIQQRPPGSIRQKNSGGEFVGKNGGGADDQQIPPQVMLLQAAQDQDGGPGHPVDQGGPAKPGLLLQPQTLGPEASAHFLAPAGEVAEEPLRLLRARPQALAVAVGGPDNGRGIPGPGSFSSACRP